MPEAADRARLPLRRREPQRSTFVRWWTGPTKAVLDALVLVASVILTVAARLDLTIASEVDPAGLAWYLAVVVVVLIGVGVVVVYRGQYRYGSFEELTVLAVVVGASSVAGLAFAVLGPQPRVVPLSVPVVSGAMALIGMAGLRWVGRRAIDIASAPDSQRTQRVVVLGAGESGYQVVRAMLKDPSSPYRPVALVDDDAAKRHLRLEGVRVLGTMADLRSVAERVQATVLVIAVRSADAAEIREIARLASDAGLRVLSVPSTHDMLRGGGELAVRDIRELTVEDLLGRHQIDTDIDEIATYLRGRRVLVTGAGGSIGSELCRQVSQFQPARLLMLDRDESALHAVQLSLEGRALLDSPDLVLADIRDVPRMHEVFDQHRPEVVFHAAALKHLPLLEANPGEALQSNVLGTLHVLEAARRAGVQRFINISTDKAADPSSVLGYTKRIAERLTAGYARDGAAYMSVRFGNVLGSRGSVLHTFADQVARGGPVTVTDRRVTRYFMTVAEAVELVIQAGAIGGAGQSLVLDMGEPVVIAELAERLADIAGRDVEVVETGLRPGEKLHEVLIGAHEVGSRPSHPLITHVPVPPLPPEAVQHLDPHGPAEVLLPLLRELADVEVRREVPGSAPGEVPDEVTSTVPPAPLGTAPHQGGTGARGARGPQAEAEAT